MQLTFVCLRFQKDFETLEAKATQVLVDLENAMVFKLCVVICSFLVTLLGSQILYLRECLCLFLMTCMIMLRYFCADLSYGAFSFLF